MPPPPRRPRRAATVRPPRPIRELPSLSDATLIMTMEDMIHATFGSEESNTVDFKLFETVLTILGRRLNLLDQKVSIVDIDVGDDDKLTQDGIQLITPYPMSGRKKSSIKEDATYVLMAFLSKLTDELSEIISKDQTINLDTASFLNLLDKNSKIKLYGLIEDVESKTEGKFLIDDYLKPFLDNLRGMSDSSAITIDLEDKTDKFVRSDNTSKRTFVKPFEKEYHVWGSEVVGSSGHSPPPPKRKSHIEEEALAILGLLRSTFPVRKIKHFINQEQPGSKPPPGWPVDQPWVPAPGTPWPKGVAWPPGTEPPPPAGWPAGTPWPPKAGTKWPAGVSWPDESDKPLGWPVNMPWPPSPGTPWPAGAFWPIGAAPPSPQGWPEGLLWPPTPGTVWPSGVTLSRIIDPPVGWPVDLTWPPEPGTPWPSGVSWPPGTEPPRPHGWPEDLPWPPPPGTLWPAAVTWPYESAYSLSSIPEGWPAGLAWPPPPGTPWPAGVSVPKGSTPPMGWPMGMPWPPPEGTPWPSEVSLQTTSDPIPVNGWPQDMPWPPLPGTPWPKGVKIPKGMKAPAGWPAEVPWPPPDDTPWPSGVARPSSTSPPCPKGWPEDLPWPPLPGTPWPKGVKIPKGMNAPAGWPKDLAWPPPAGSAWPAGVSWPAEGEVPKTPPGWPEELPWPPASGMAWPEGVSIPAGVAAPQGWPAELPWPPQPGTSWPSGASWPDIQIRHDGSLKMKAIGLSVRQNSCYRVRRLEDNFTYVRVGRPYPISYRTFYRVSLGWVHILKTGMAQHKECLPERAAKVRRFALASTRVGTVECVTVSQFELLKKSVKELQKMTDPIPMPTMPVNKKLIKEVTSGNASLTDTMEAMKVVSRVQTMEDAVGRLSAMVSALAAGIGKKVKDQEQELQVVKPPPSATLMEAPSPRYQVPAASIKPSMASMDVPCVTRAELANALGSLREQLSQEIEDMKRKITTAADASVVQGKIIMEKLEEVVSISLRINSLQDVVAEYYQQLEGLESGITIQIKTFNDQLTLLKNDLDCGLNLLANVNSNKETLAVMDLTERYEGLLGDLDGLLHLHTQLDDKQRGIADELRQLIHAVERVSEQKADHDELADGLKDKADQSTLAGLLTELDFLKAMDGIKEKLEACYIKFNKQDDVWHEALNDLLKMIDQKADYSQVFSWKDNSLEDLRKLHCQVKLLAMAVGEPKAALLARQLATDAFCGACAEAAFMQVEESRETQQHADIPHDATCIGSYKKLFDKEEDKRHLCKRWVGGSHTLITNMVVTRARAEAPDVQAVPMRRYTAMGKDGKLYQCASEMKACEECTVLHPTPRDPPPPGAAHVTRDPPPPGAAHVTYEAAARDSGGLTGDPPRFSLREVMPADPQTLPMDSEQTMVPVESVVQVSPGRRQSAERHSSTVDGVRVRGVTSSLDIVATHGAARSDRLSDNHPP